MPRTIEVVANPHRGQLRVHNDTSRFKVLACGRRWGKTRLGVHECIEVASKGGRAWWVSPSYKTGEVGWRPLKDLGAKIGAEIRKVDRQINLSGGGSVTVRSADNPDSLRGEGLDFVVLDECAFIAEEAWTHALRPALSDRQGSAMFISTPKGMNWFWRMFTKGQDELELETASWRFPTSDNPYIPDEEIEAARRSLPERIYRQEYLAEFITDAGGVFRRVMEAAIAEPQEKALFQHDYVMGVDWGRSNDFTVITVLDTNTNELVAMDRFTNIDYAIQVNRLKAIAARFKPVQIIAEMNSMGGPLVEQLQLDGLPVKGFMTTSASKEEAIRALEGAFERGEIHIINDPVLIGELQAYEQEQLPAGKFRFSAPAGMHDDCVISLAIAWHSIATSFFMWPEDQDE